MGRFMSEAIYDSMSLPTNIPTSRWSHRRCCSPAGPPRSPSCSRYPIHQDPLFQFLWTALTSNVVPPWWSCMYQIRSSCTEVRGRGLHTLVIWERSRPGRPLDLTFSLCVDLGSKRAIAGGDEYVVRAGREHGSRELVGHSVLLNHRGF